MKSRFFILIFICIITCSCTQFTRLTGIKSIKTLTLKKQFDSVALLKIDSNWCILINKSVLSKNINISYDTLLKYTEAQDLNDTLIIDIRNVNYRQTSYIRSVFVNELINKKGLCYNYREKYYAKKIIFEPFEYYYGPLAAGAGWQYRIKGTEVILKRRFKWIS